MSERTSNVAIYWDFENIQASLVEKKGGREAYGRTKYQQQETLIDIDSVMEFAATFGVVSINRAYCNWQWYGKYRESLLRNGLELIQLFHPGASAKNGGDIKLALDCTEDLLRFPHVDVVVIVGGDSDYLPLAQKIKALGKTLVGIGTQANTNRHWARGCHEFKFYETLILEEEAPSAGSAPQPGQNPAPVVQVEAHPDNVVTTPPEELLRRAILRLSGKGGDSWVLKGSIRPMMKRLDPTFDEEQHGARSFGAFIRKFEHLLEIRAGRNDQEIRMRGMGGPARGGEGVPEGGPERPRTDSGRDRDRRDRRREEPADRTPGRVAERIAQALANPAEESRQEGESPASVASEQEPVQSAEPVPTAGGDIERPLAPEESRMDSQAVEGSGDPHVTATEESKPKGGRSRGDRRGGKASKGTGAEAARKEDAPERKPAPQKKGGGKKPPKV